MSAARRSSSTARRSLLTATAAGTLLGALWFVPSAHATQNAPEQQQTRVQTTTTLSQVSAESGTESRTVSDEGSGTESVTGARLADTGGFDTTPYLMGGTAFLGLGAAFVVYSVRRERMTAY